MNLPNLFTYSRFLFSGLVLISSYLQNKSLFTIFLVLGLLSDMLDGVLARKLGASKNGGTLDSLADEFLMSCAFYGLFLMRRATFLKYFFPLGTILLFFIIVQATSYMSKKKLLFSRTKLALAAAISFPVMVSSLLFYESIIPVFIYVFLMYASLSGKLLSLFSKKTTTSVIILCFFLAVGAVWAGKKELICFGDKCINVEVMDTPEKKALGLMFREGLTDEQGMVFFFNPVARPTFWMKNMRFSIDMIFVSEDNKVVYIAKSVPPCITEPCELYTPDKDTAMVIEVASGFCERYAINVETLVTR